MIQKGAGAVAAAVYIAFGEALGQMNETIMDVHGSGAQHSDPKSGDPEQYLVINENARQGDVW